MVVVGAFYEYGVNEIVRSEDYKAVYVIPVGPTEIPSTMNELYNLPTTIRMLGGYSGYISLFLFTFLGIFQNKIIRRKLEIRGLHIHKKLVLGALFFGLIHVLGVYGYYFFRITWTNETLFDFFFGIFIPPEILPSSRESLGLFFSKVSVYLFLMILLILYPIRFINSGLSYKYRAQIHKILFSIFIFVSFFHSYLNSLYLSNADLFFILIILGLVIWLFLKLYQYSSKRLES